MKSCLMFSAVAAAAFAVQILAAQACNVSAMVTVLDRKSNQPIDGLTASDFHAKFQGHEIPIASIKGAPSERRLLFVVDRSGSMTEKIQGDPNFSYDANHEVNLILKDAAPAIPGTDTVAFLAFSGDFSTQTDFVDPGSAIEKMRAILTWSPAGKGNKHGTALWDNIDAAFRMLGPPRQGDVIVVVSDGGDNRSKLHEEDVRSELLRAGVPVIAMMLGYPLAGGLEESAGVLNLLDLAKETGGSVMMVGPVSAPDIALDLHPGGLILLLAHQYSIEFAIPALQKPEKWQLEVTPTNAPRATRVFYPRHLSPCGANQQLTQK